MSTDGHTLHTRLTINLKFKKWLFRKTGQNTQKTEQKKGLSEDEHTLMNTKFNKHLCIENWTKKKRTEPNGT